VVGLSACTKVDSHVDGATFEPEVRINGSVVLTDTLTVAANVAYSGYQTATAGTYAFAAGDTLALSVTITGTATFNQAFVNAEVVYDR
jgi:hypothetical protein